MADRKPKPASADKKKAPARKPKPADAAAKKPTARKPKPKDDAAPKPDEVVAATAAAQENVEQSYQEPAADAPKTRGRKPKPVLPDPVKEKSNAASTEIQSFIDRMVKLSEEKKAVADDMKDVMAEAKVRGYDTKAIRRLVKEHTQDKSVLMEEEAIYELYRNALGTW